MLFPLIKSKVEVADLFFPEIGFKIEVQYYSVY